MQIWKFVLNIQDVQTVLMPQGATILSVANQRGVACLWAMVDPSNSKEMRTIEIIETGNNIHPSEPYERRFIGTALVGTFVWHVFERVDSQ